ncbi:Lrp/AsnC family transcriptional regulator [Intrasporangium sp.]|uniref:Lrp/AsnC family transcriptional regulator n=1 Tax=Intrasporangium sp. TaxID=1925024 RepID=UPI0032214286
MDNLDWQIVEALQQDGRRSYRQMGRDLGVSPGTVRLRTRQLIDDGYLRVIGVPTARLLGRQFQATIALKLEPGHARAVAELLAERPEVGWIGLTTSSRYDVLFEVILDDSRAFGPYREEFLAGLPGCRDIEVFEIWDVPKFSYDLAQARSADDEPTSAPSTSRSPRTGAGADADPSTA